MQSELDDISPWWQRCGCMRNPGAHTGEEAARDSEIKELRMYAKKLESLIEDLKADNKVLTEHLDNSHGGDYE